MNNKKNYYEILGVERSCSAAEIRKAYHKLARKYHPDVTLLEKSYAEYMMASVSEAYKVLSDADSRAAYDAELDRPAPSPQPQDRPQDVRYDGSYSSNHNRYNNSGSYESSYENTYGNSYRNTGSGYYGSPYGNTEPADRRYYQSGNYTESHRMPEDFAGRVFYVFGFLWSAAVNVFREDPLIRKVITAFAAIFLLNLFVTFMFFISGNGKGSSIPASASDKAVSAVSGAAVDSGRSVRNTVSNTVENYKDNIKGFTTGHTDSDFYKFAGMEPYMSYMAYKNMFPEIKLTPIDRVLNVSRYSCYPAFGPPFKGFPSPSSTVLGFDSSNRLCMVSYYFSPDEFTQVKNYYYAALGPFLKHRDTYFFKRGDFVVMLDPYSSDTNKASLSFCVDVKNILKEN